MSEARRRRAEGLALAVALGCFAGLPGSAGAETELGPILISGHLELGGRGIAGGDWSSAKFREYRSIRPGFLAQGQLLFEDETHRNFVRTWIDFTDKDDQHYEIQAGRYNWYGFSLEYSEYPHNFSRNARTPYSRGYDGNLTLPDSWDHMAPLTGELATQSRGRDLGFNLIDGRAGAYAKPRPDLELSADYRILQRRGTQFLSLGFGSPGGNFSNVAGPVDEKTHEVVGALKLARDTWSFGLDYTGSFFDNDLDDVTVDNPIQGSDLDGTSSRGRLAEAPDNSAHQVTLSGATILPTSFPSRFAGTFSYGLRLQDDDFIPHTVNSALAPFDTTGPLDDQDLDGEVHTWLGNLVFTARPLDDLNIKARYRIYDFDNETDRIRFDERVSNDRSVTPGAFVAEPNEYRTQNAYLDASWSFAEGATLTAGYEWENWDRNDVREVRHLNAHTGKLKLDARPTPWLTLQTSYRITGQDGNKYFTMGSQLEELRKFDEDDLLRNQLDARAQFDLREDLSFGVSGGYAYTDNDGDFGLRSVKSWNIGTDVGYAPLDWLSLSAYYTYDWSNSKQRSIDRSSTAQTPSTDPDLVWNSRSKDWAHNVGVDALATLIPERLDAELGYLFQRGRAKTNASGANGVAESYPDVKDKLHNLTATLTYHVLEHLSLKGRYRWEKLDLDDFQTDLIPASLTNSSDDVFLGNSVDDYDAHIFTGSVVWEF